jgi:hypothetical protein
MSGELLRFSVVIKRRQAEPDYINKALISQAIAEYLPESMALVDVSEPETITQEEIEAEVNELIEMLKKIL